MDSVKRVKPIAYYTVTLLNRNRNTKENEYR